MEQGEEECQYFQEYGNLEIHQLMLRDVPRCIAYKNAIFQNASYFKGKTVLDVGAGSGLLSVFCAQADAAKVYAVEASSLYKIAEEIVAENKFEHVIKVIHCKIEDFKLEVGEKVDIIVSEWMGFYLLHEGMLDSVIFARDNFLKPGGSIFPDSASIHCAPCSIPSLFNFWTNVHGVSMESMGKKLRLSKSDKPDVIDLKADDILTEPKTISWINLNDITVEELDAHFVQEVVVAQKAGTYQGLALWFSCQFPNKVDDRNNIVLSTSPMDTPTHWKQTVVVLPNAITVEVGEPLAFELNIKRSMKNRRRYNIEFTMMDPEKVIHPEPCECYLTKCIIIKKMLEQYEKEDIEDKSDS